MRSLKLNTQQEIGKARKTCLASTMACLQLLQGRSNLSRLEVFVPLAYNLEYDYEAFVCLGSHEQQADSYQLVYEAIGKLHISTELRINCKEPAKDLKRVGKLLGLERLVVFLSVRTFLDHGKGITIEECDQDLWLASGDKYEMLIQFRPVNHNKDETAIDAMWPTQIHEKTPW